MDIFKVVHFLHICICPMLKISDKKHAYMYYNPNNFRCVTLTFVSDNNVQ